MAEPTDRSTSIDGVSLAAFAAIELLPIDERLSFVLHDLFGVEFEEIEAMSHPCSSSCHPNKRTDNHEIGSNNMQSRIENPALSVPGVMPALQRLAKAVADTNVPETTRYLVELRASQINGCAVCVDMHSRELRAAGEPDERIFTVATWRDVPYFTDAERAALALTEAATRLADRPDPVPDDVWEEASRHYDERELAALVVSIATINAWNRINAATGQVSGEWVAEWIGEPTKQAA